MGNATLRRTRMASGNVAPDTAEAPENGRSIAARRSRRCRTACSGAGSLSTSSTCRAHAVVLLAAAPRRAALAER